MCQLVTMTQSRVLRQDNPAERRLRAASAFFRSCGAQQGRAQSATRPSWEARSWEWGPTAPGPARESARFISRFDNSERKWGRAKGQALQLTRSSSAFWWCPGQLLSGSSAGRSAAFGHRSRAFPAGRGGDEREAGSLGPRPTVPRDPPGPPPRPRRTARLSPPRGRRQPGAAPGRPPRRPALQPAAGPRTAAPAHLRARRPAAAHRRARTPPAAQTPGGRDAGHVAHRPVGRGRGGHV